MAIEVIMPKVDMVMESGTFVEWLKKDGERVSKGDPIFVITTDKAAIEVEITRGWHSLRRDRPSGRCDPGYRNRCLHPRRWGSAACQSRPPTCAQSFRAGRIQHGAGDGTGSRRRGGLRVG